MVQFTKNPDSSAKRLVLLNVSSFYHDIARGAVIILAVYLDTRRKQSLLRRLLAPSAEEK